MVLRVSKHVGGWVEMSKHLGSVKCLIMGDHCGRVRNGGALWEGLRCPSMWEGSKWGSIVGGVEMSEHVGGLETGEHGGGAEMSKHGGVAFSMPCTDI